MRLLSRAVLRSAIAVVALASLALSVPVMALAGDAGPSAQVAASQDAKSVEALLAARGLIGRPGTVQSHKVAPPPGVEVDDSVQRNSATHQVLLRIKSWKEILDGNVLYIEVTSAPTGQHEIAFWLMPRDQGGCKLFGWTMYDRDGQALRSTFWRNDPAINIAGAAAPFPTDLYPDSVPGMAFFRTLGAAHQGAAGVLKQQITPYSYVSQDVSITRTERITVPAGTFSAFEVSARPRVQSLMPSWPSFILHVVQPFVPKSTLYFQAQAPHRLLKQEGASSLGGPAVTLELVRYYTQGKGTAQSTASAAPAGAPDNASQLAMNGGG